VQRKGTPHRAKAAIRACITRLGLLGENGYRDLTELRAAVITKSLVKIAFTSTSLTYRKIKILCVRLAEALF